MRRLLISLFLIGGAVSLFASGSSTNGVESEAMQYVRVFENSTNAFHAEFQGLKYQAWKKDLEELTGPLSVKDLEVAGFVTGYYMVRYKYGTSLSGRRYNFLIQLTAEGLGKKRFYIAYHFFIGSDRLAKYAVYAYKEISSYMDKKFEEYDRKYQEELRGRTN